MANGDTARMKVLVTPEWDKNEAKKAIRNAQDLYKELRKMKVEWGGVAKQASLNISSIRNISKAAEEFSKSLSTNVKKSATKLAELGGDLEDLSDQAEAIRAQMGKVKGAGAQAALQKALSDTTAKMANLNKQIDDHLKANKKYGAQMHKQLTLEKRRMGEMKKFEDYFGRDAAKEMFKSLSAGIQSGGIKGLLGGLKGVGGAAVKGAKGTAARQMAMGGEAAGLARVIPMIAKAAGPIAAIAAVLGTFVAVLKKAMDYQAELNKSLLSGIGTANDWVGSSKSYVDSLNDMRNAVLNSNDVLRQYYMSAKEGSDIINAFAKTSSGSMVRTVEELRRLEGGLEAGTSRFIENSIVYGKALGMEAKDVAGMMGEFVNEVGFGTQQVQDMMGGVVKMAATANMPLGKFMDIFRQMAPHVDLFTNRIEQLTGTIKLLSKSMSPRDVKNFMDAFSKGFEKVDFKQRLKMALIVGPQKITKILKKDFSGALEGIKKSFAEKGGSAGAKLADELGEAMSGKRGDVVKAVREVTGKAMALGIEPAAIGAAQKMARSQRLLQKGGALNVAGAMRGAGVRSRMEILEEYAGKLTGGDIEGLGEHVAKQLGVSEQEYKAILQLQDAMGAYKATAAKYGRLQSKSMNDNLKVLLKSDANAQKAADKLGADLSTEKGFEDVVKYLAANSPEELESLIKDASSMEIEKADEDKISMEDLAKVQIEEQRTIGDKIENVIGYYLEELFKVIAPFVDAAIRLLKEIVDWLPGTDPEKSARKGISAGVYAGIAKASSKRLAERDPTAKKLEKKYLTKKEKERGDIDEKLNRMVRVGLGGTAATAEMTGENAMEAIRKVWEASGKSAKVAEQLGLTPEGLKKAIDESKMGKEGEAGKKEEGGFAAKLKDILLAPHIKGIVAADEKFREFKKTGTGKALTAAGKAVHAQQLESLDPRKGIGLGIKQFGKLIGFGGGAEGEIQTEATEEQTKETVDATEEQAEVTVASLTDIYSVLEDIAGILREGVNFESSWLNGDFFNTIKSATLESLQEALLEHVVLMAKLMEDTEFRKQIAGRGEELLGGSMRELVGAPTGSDAKAWFESRFGGTVGPGVAVTEKKTEVGTQRSYEGKIEPAGGPAVPGMQSGGPIMQGGLYELHRGERVLSAAETAAAGRAGGVKNFNMTINGANMSVQEMKSVALATFEEMARRS